MATQPLIGDPDYAALKRHVIESTGLAYYDNKDADFTAHVSGRMFDLAMRSCRAYLDLLQDRERGESERHLLISRLTIGETYFFRHIEQLDALCDVALPEIIERNGASRTLRIWCAGCATGAEPYTLAILLQQRFGERLAGWSVRILGTDINQTFLARATRGEFDERAFRTTPDDVKQAWFSRSGAVWRVSDAIRSVVSFQYHNLVEHPYPSIVHGIAALDVILCRNVMIYFDWPTIHQILGRFRDCLVDGGWLAVGHAESNTDLFRTYRTVNVPGATLYQRNEMEQPAFRPAWTADLKVGHSVHGDLGQLWAPPVLPDRPALPRVESAHAPAPPRVTGSARVRQLADQGRWTDAARACVEELARNQMDPALHFLQGLIAEQMGHDSDAERALRKTIYLERRSVLAHYHLALILAKRGDTDAARRSFENARRLVAAMPPHQHIADAEGLTAEELADLVTMQTELLPQ